ncbi:hypothetical protein SESBI_45421 [Sesbania bispinosa]|nr:hypothetical protein SESBI_45421 [Sesbania bispinosa]
MPLPEADLLHGGDREEGMNRGGECETTRPEKMPRGRRRRGGDVRPSHSGGGAHVRDEGSDC